MKKYTRLITLLVLAAVAACTTVPITGRKQLNLIPQGEMLSMSYQQYSEFLKANRVSRDAGQTALVKRVGARIQGAVERYFATHGMSDRINNYKWEFNLVDSDEINAWCMPGGKVVIYSGILPVTQSEAGLAVVMGHEIAHAVAEHGNERMSQQLLTQLGGAALFVALRDKPEQTKNLWLATYGAGTTIGLLLPFSRSQESEADRLGLIFMTMAGYDPNESVAFWQRMAAKKGGGAPPEFLSTHPSDQTRINNLKRLIPEAQQYAGK